MPDGASSLIDSSEIFGVLRSPVLQRRNTYGKPKKSCGEKRRLSAVLRGVGAEEERWRRR